MAKLIISSPAGAASENASRRTHPRRRRKSRSRIARDFVNRLPGAWLMDVQESYSDSAR